MQSERPSETSVGTEPSNELGGEAFPEPTFVIEPLEDNSFDRTQHSLRDPQSIWFIANKKLPFEPKNYVPKDLIVPAGVPNRPGEPLQAIAAEALKKLYADAYADGIRMRLISAYRSYNTQVSLYNRYVVRDGQAAADTYSARPGHSEHQTGLVVDFDEFGNCYLVSCFEGTASGKWLQANAYKYGFTLRYLKGKESITGYIYEPWHYRYVGPELAAELQGKNLTLEEFFELPAAGKY
ncbi:MAG: M15 family metallopeptidase [Microbacteriaceae bacterium]